MLAPTSPSVASSRSGSMRRKRPPASRKFWIWEAASLTTRPPLVGRSPARDDPVLVYVEQLGQDPASHRRGGVRAEAPGLVGHGHYVLRVRVGRERDIPGLVCPAEPLLRRARLAGHGDREALEDGRRRAARGARGAPQPVEDRLPV